MAPNGVGNGGRRTPLRSHPTSSMRGKGNSRRHKSAPVRKSKVATVSSVQIPEQFGELVVSTPVNESLQANDEAVEMLPGMRSYAAGWGWNSDAQVGRRPEQGRSGGPPVGGGMVPTLVQVQSSAQISIAGAAAGGDHSVLLASSGVLYAFGTNRRKQLGFGNIWNDTQVYTSAPSLQQATPRQVNPSGLYVQKRDLMMAEVTAGKDFSVAREVSPDEAVMLVEGLKELDDAITGLISLFNDSHSLSLALAHLKHEHTMVRMMGQGRLLSWGSGKQGELGLEVNPPLGPTLTELLSLGGCPELGIGLTPKPDRTVIYSPVPRVLPSLMRRSVVMTQISAGQHHVLALSQQGHVYAWGAGHYGKLGLGDFFPRYAPCLVESVAHLNTKQVAAGQSHSAILVEVPPYNASLNTKAVGKSFLGRNTGPSGRYSTPKPSSKLNALFDADIPVESSDPTGGMLDGDGSGHPANRVFTQYKVFCFGKGSYGRLGHGGNSNKIVPTLVEKWPAMLAISRPERKRRSPEVLNEIKRRNRERIEARQAWLEERQRKHLSPDAILAAVNDFDSERRSNGFKRNISNRFGDKSDDDDDDEDEGELILEDESEFEPLTDLGELQFRSISCGGAHTVVLASRPVAKSLVFPLGVQTYVLTWGYGGSGQLGVGNTENSYIPVLTHLPKAEVVVKIAAGRSMTLAMTSQGKLYSWGLGTRGQLGQGIEGVELTVPDVDQCSSRQVGLVLGSRKILGRQDGGRTASFVPREVNCPGGVVDISAGQWHALALYLPKRMMNPHVTDVVYRSLLFPKDEKIDISEINSLLHIGNRLAKPPPRVVEQIAMERAKAAKLRSLKLTKIRKVKFIPPTMEEVYEQLSLSRANLFLSHREQTEKRLTIAGRHTTLKEGDKSKALVITQDDSNIESNRSYHSLQPHEIDNPHIFRRAHSKSTCWELYRSSLDKTLQRHHRGGLFDLFASLSSPFQPKLQRRKCMAEFGFDCCRRMNGPQLTLHQQLERFVCNTCNVTSICWQCVRMCHRGHNIKGLGLPPVFVLPICRDTNVDENSPRVGDKVNPPLRRMISLRSRRIQKSVSQSKGLSLSTEEELDLQTVRERLGLPIVAETAEEWMSYASLTETRALLQLEGRGAELTISPVTFPLPYRGKRAEPARHPYAAPWLRQNLEELPTIPPLSFGIAVVEAAKRALHEQVVDVKKTAECNLSIHDVPKYRFPPLRPLYTVLVNETKQLVAARQAAQSEEIAGLLAKRRQRASQAKQKNRSTSPQKVSSLNTNRDTTNATGVDPDAVVTPLVYVKQLFEKMGYDIRGGIISSKHPTGTSTTTASNFKRPTSGELFRQLRRIYGVQACHCALYNRKCCILPDITENVAMEAVDAISSPLISTPVSQLSPQAKSHHLSPGSTSSGSPGFKSPQNTEMISAKARKLLGLPTQPISKKARRMLGLTIDSPRESELPTLLEGRETTAVDEFDDENVTAKIVAQRRVVKRVDSRLAAIHDNSLISTQTNFQHVFNNLLLPAQANLRRILVQKRMQQRKQEAKSVRIAVCRWYVETKVMFPVLQRVEKVIIACREAEERERMSYEEKETRFFLGFRWAQTQQTGFKAMSFGVRELVGRASIQLPVWKGDHNDMMMMEKRLRGTEMNNENTRNSESESAVVPSRNISRIGTATTATTSNATGLIPGPSAVALQLDRTNSTSSMKDSLSFHGFDQLAALPNSRPGTSDRRGSRFSSSSQSGKSVGGFKRLTSERVGGKGGNAINEESDFSSSDDDISPLATGRSIDLSLDATSQRVFSSTNRVGTSNTAATEVPSARHAETRAQTPHWGRIERKVFVPLDWYPSFAFTVEDLRSQQLRLHPADRLPHGVLAIASRYYPRVSHYAPIPFPEALFRSKKSSNSNNNSNNNRLCAGGLPPVVLSPNVLTLAHPALPLPEMENVDANTKVFPFPVPTNYAELPINRSLLPPDGDLYLWLRGYGVGGVIEADETIRRRLRAAAREKWKRHRVEVALNRLRRRQELILARSRALQQQATNPSITATATAANAGANNINRPPPPPPSGAPPPPPLKPRQPSTWSRELVAYRKLLPHLRSQIYPDFSKDLPVAETDILRIQARRRYASIYPKNETQQRVTMITSIWQRLRQTAELEKSNQERQLTLRSEANRGGSKARTMISSSRNSIISTIRGSVNTGGTTSGTTAEEDWDVTCDLSNRFDPFADIPVPVFRMRRASIADPSYPYYRLCKAPKALQTKAIAHRRLSLPLVLTSPINYIPDPKRLEKLEESLILYNRPIFNLRTLTSDLLGLLHPQREVSAFSSVHLPAERSKRWKILHQRLSRLFQSSCLSTRLPIDFRQPTHRRRSISGEERAARVLDAAVERIWRFVEVENTAKELFGVKRRRRSFDRGECFDVWGGWHDELLDGRERISPLEKFHSQPGVASFSPPSINDLKQHSGDLDYRLIMAGLVADLTPEMMREQSLARKIARQWEQNNPKVVPTKAETTLVTIEEKPTVAGATRFANESSEKKTTPNPNPPVEVAVWRVYYSEDGYPYYYRPETGESVWEAPESSPHCEVQFETRHDHEDSAYWYNHTTGESQWDEE